jgi:hypothetical protein
MRRVRNPPHHFGDVYVIYLTISQSYELTIYFDAGDHSSHGFALLLKLPAGDGEDREWHRRGRLDMGENT